MKQHLLRFSCLLLVPLTALGQGRLSPPPGPPAPTMTSLADLGVGLNQANNAALEANAKAEKRTPISSLPFTISVPGSYYLTADLTCTEGSIGIRITASGVTLDLNGFTLKGCSGGTSAIFADSQVDDVTVRNGFVTGWSVAGVHLQGRYIRVEDVTVSINGDGIVCGSGCVVVNCVAGQNAGSGMKAGSGALITNSASRSNGDAGFVLSSGSSVQQCVASLNNGIGITTGVSSVVARSVVWVGGSHGISVGSRSLVLDNISTGHGQPSAAGIVTSGNYSRIEGNHSTQNSRGIVSTGAGNLIVKNTAAESTAANSNYVISANNKVGPILNPTNSPAINHGPGSTAVSSLGTTDPWANFSY
jgi:hypothetical protein